MSKLKLNRFAILFTAGAISSISISGCVTIKDYYQEYFGMDKSTREVTGYYEHVDSKVYRNTIVVPEGMDNPGTNLEMALPVVDKASLTGPLGEDMDVRPPTAPYRSDRGIHTEWADGEAIVWFDRGGEHGIQTEDDAWMLLASVLKRMRVGVGKIADGQYLLTTISRNYTEYGKPYGLADYDMGLKKYNQIYQIRVGRRSDGSLGIASKLIGSMTALSKGTAMQDILAPIEQERFAMGFSNHIIHEIESKNVQTDVDPDNLVVYLGDDGNNHQAIVVEAPFETTNLILADVFDKAGWKVVKHSVEKAEYEVEIKDNVDNWTNTRDLKLMNIPTGTYKVRVGLIPGSDGSTKASAITFYNEKDIPIPGSDVSRLYPGFAEALIEDYKTYSGVNAVRVSVD